MKGGLVEEKVSSSIVEFFGSLTCGGISLVKMVTIFIIGILVCRYSILELLLFEDDFVPRHSTPFKDLLRSLEKADSRHLDVGLD